MNKYIYRIDRFTIKLNGMIKRFIVRHRAWYLKTFKGYYNPFITMKDGSVYFKTSKGSLRRVSDKKRTRFQKASFARRRKVQEYQEFFK